MSLSNIVLHTSKRAIFAAHREDIKRVEELLAEAEKILAGLFQKFGGERIIMEGAYQAGAEEYAEAKMFYQAVKKGKIEAIKEVKLGMESYLGGLCDLTGELVRRAINQAAAGKLAEVEKMRKAIDDIMAELVEFDFTGYLRTKYDQAKNNLRKMEQVNYEIMVKRK